MGNSFLDQLRSDFDLSEVERKVIQQAQVRTPKALISLVWNFPCLSQIGCNLARMSNAALKLGGPALMSAGNKSGAARGKPPRYARGAQHPQGAPAAPGTPVKLPPAGGGGPPPVSRSAVTVDRNDWPIRDQGDRGTCVAFSFTALREHLAFRRGEAPNRDFDLSEQYMFWATKTQSGDPAPNADGSLLGFAREALSSAGICLRDHWVYDPIPNPACVHHGTSHDPSRSAKTDAVNWRFDAAMYRKRFPKKDVVELVHGQLAHGNAVAVTVPVFKDPTQATDNWNTQEAIDEGLVMDPPPTSIVDEGHAVCLVGFEPDTNEPCGGWFIVRNSWGNRWATNPTVPGGRVGYGRISATYLNDYVWEICGL